MFLNTDLELLEVDNITDELKTVLGQEYTLIDANGNIKVQNDKVGKIIIDTNVLTLIESIIHLKYLTDIKIYNIIKVNYSKCECT